MNQTEQRIEDEDALEKRLTCIHETPQEDRELVQDILVELHSILNVPDNDADVVDTLGDAHLVGHSKLPRVWPPTWWLEAG